MRIIITHQHPIDAPGGGTRSCRKIVSHLEKLGVDVILIFITSKQYAMDDVNRIPVKTNPVNYLLSSISVASEVKKILASGKKVDAVISWEYESAFLINLLRSQKIPFCMIAAHPSYESHINRPANNFIKQLSDRWFRWRSLKQADIVFVSSEFTQRELVNLLQVQPSNIKKIYRGIDEVFLQPKTKPIEVVSNFIFYGSFAPNKGVFDAIGALGKVAKRGYTNWTLKLAGWGNEDQLKAAIQENDIEKQVCFLGKLAPQELAKELKEAHITILPSRAESFGRAIAEAQASSLAVISYASGSIPELIENDVTGWMVPTGNVSLLANAVVKAIQNPDKVSQMGIAGHKRVIEKYTWSKTTQLILEGIDEAKKHKIPSPSLVG